MSLLTEVLEETEQGSELWQKIRLGKFTASRAGDWVCLRGEITDGALTYIAEKIAEITTGEEQETFESEDMVWGKTHEPEARRLYAEKTGLETRECGFILLNEFFGGSPDGLVEPAGILEIKCPKTKTHVKNIMATDAASLKKLNKRAFYQIQANLLVTGRMWAHFVSYDPRCAGSEFYLLHIKKDEKAIGELQASLDMLVGKLKEVLARMKTAA